MSRRVPTYVLRLGLLVSFVVLALSACGGGGQEQAKVRQLPEDQRPLRPDRYSSDEFKPAFTIEVVGKGWQTIGMELRDALSLAHGDSTLDFLNVEEVHKPTRTGTTNKVSAPNDLAAWLQKHPYLETEEPEPLTIGGVKGVQFDAVVSDLPEDFFGYCGQDCLDLFGESSGGGIFIDGEDKVRFIVLEDVKGETVTIMAGGPAVEFEEFLPKAHKVLDTVEWKGT